MKVLIIFAHPNTNSFNHAILEKVIAGLKLVGHEFRLKDLYQENFNRSYQLDERDQLRQGKAPPRIIKEHSNLLWAEGLIFIYPGGANPPGKLKGWFMLVLAMKYTNSEVKLKNYKALVIMTTSDSKDYFTESDPIELNPWTRKPLKIRSTLKNYGIENLTHNIFLDVTSKTDEERAKILAQAEQMGEQF